MQLSLLRLSIFKEPENSEPSRMSTLVHSIHTARLRTKEDKSPESFGCVWPSHLPISPGDDCTREGYHLNPLDEPCFIPPKLHMTNFANIRNWSYIRTANYSKKRIMQKNKKIDLSISLSCASFRNFVWIVRHEYQIQDKTMEKKKTKPKTKEKKIK